MNPSKALPRRRRGLAACAIAVVSALVFAAGCSAAPQETGPVELTWWVRAANEAKSKTLADAWNATHENKVTVTAFPDDQFVTRVGTATASGQVPDLLASDAVYMPTFIERGIYLDLTDRLASFKHKDSLFPQLTEVATDANGRVFALPRDPATSLLFWNKDLFQKAGLDPDKAPATWDEIIADAAKIQALGGGVNGFYLAGNCAGCNAFTYLPMLWASGGDVLTDDGADFKNATHLEGMKFLRTLWEQKTIPEGAKADGGENWLTGFTAGTVGIQPLGSFAIGSMAANPDLNYGVAPFPGSTPGKGASFIGGDVIGIPAKAKHADAAWEFIAWTLSDEVQLEIVAKSGELVSRTDLVDNKYSSANPNVVVANQALAVGRVPQSKLYQQLIQDPNGPFLLMLQASVFNGTPAAEAAEAAQTTAEEIVATAR